MGIANTGFVCPPLDLDPKCRKEWGRMRRALVEGNESVKTGGKVSDKC